MVKQHNIFGSFAFIFLLIGLSRTSGRIRRCPCSPTSKAWPSSSRPNITRPPWTKCWTSWSPGAPRWSRCEAN